MARFCGYCGNPMNDFDITCGQCGKAAIAPVPTPGNVPVSERKPVRKAAPMPAQVKLANQGMRVVHFVLIGLMVISLILGILNFAGKYSVTVTAVAKYGGEVQREKQSMPLAEIYAVKEYAGLSLAGFALGVFQLFMSGFAGFLAYCRFRGARGMKKKLKRFCVAGLVGNGVYLLLVWLLGTHKESLGSMTLKATVHPHFTVWLSILVLAMLYCVAFFSRERRRRR